MAEKNKPSMTEDIAMQNGRLDSHDPDPAVDGHAPSVGDATIILPSVPPTPRLVKGDATIVDATHSLPATPSQAVTTQTSSPTKVTIQTSPPTKVVKKASSPTKVNKRETANIHMLQEQCRRLCLSLFATDQSTLRSLGFTSSIGGEGKSFLAAVTARVLARDSNEPVTLVECNWAHPTLHETFALPATPGLAEWLKGMCSEAEARYQVDENLTVIPAGNGGQDAVKLLKLVQQHGLHTILKRSGGLLIVDLPSVIASSYGSLAASLVDTVVLVVRSEAITDHMLAETCAQLKDASIHGIILNQGNSHIPRWLRQLL